MWPMSRTFSRITRRFWVFVIFFYVGNLYAQQTRQADADSSSSSEQEYMHIRGIERDQKDGGAALQTAANVLLFLPRTVVDGLFYSTGYGAHLVDDTKFIEKAEDFFYFSGRNFGWYPVLTLGSGTAYGATAFYRASRFGVSIGGYYGGSDFWRAKINLLHSFRKGNTVWRVNFSGKIKKRSDFEFFGFGPDPENDSRNAFLPDAADEAGIFAQRLSRLQLVVGVRPSSRWQFFYTGFYQERRLSSPGAGDAGDIENIFDLTSLPGVAAGRATTGKQIYNEIAARFDTRKYRGQIYPGVRIEGYAGLAAGVRGDESRFARAGLDAAFYIPVIKSTRLIVPRVIFDMVENLNDDVALSFADFPRQPAFRGVSRRTLLRTDEISMIPSLEYQWPLSYNLRGHLFADYLLVGDSVGDLTFTNAPYAVGFGIDLHSVDSELARFTIAAGSEGFRLFLSVGLSNHTNDRAKWE